MGTKKLWSINGGRTWHRAKNKIYLPIDSEKVYTLIFSQFNNVNLSPVQVKIDSSQKKVLTFKYPSIGIQANINLSNLNQEEMIVNTLLIDGLQDTINI